MSISLGFNCRAAELSVANGLRGRRSDGYRTCPFDLMFTLYDSLCEILENDFRDFCNPDFLTLVFCEGQPRIVHTHYSCVFNHESPDHFSILGDNERWTGPCHFTENNYERFIERYQRRIENFREYVRTAIEDGIEIVFVVCRYNDVPTKLDGVLSRAYPSLKYRLVYVDDSQPEVELGQLKFLDRGVPETDVERLTNYTERRDRVGNCIHLNDFMNSR